MLLGSNPSVVFRSGLILIERFGRLSYTPVRNASEERANALYHLSPVGFEGEVTGIDQFHLGYLLYLFLRWRISLLPAGRVYVPSVKQSLRKASYGPIRPFSLADSHLSAAHLIPASPRSPRMRIVQPPLISLPRKFASPHLSFECAEHEP